MQVNWYRNASEKENDNANGTGEMMNILFPAQASESIAIIVDRKGNFVEKNLSLIKQADLEMVVDTSELEVIISQLRERVKGYEADIADSKKTVERLDLEHGERKVLLEAVGGKLEEANKTIAELKKPTPKPVSPATTKVTPKK